MTPEEAAAQIAAINAEREAEYRARRAAITPHVRRPAPRRSYAQLSAEYGRYGTGYLDRAAARSRAEAATYCGAPITTEDWDRREARARVHAAAAAERGVCPACLAAARAD